MELDLCNKEWKDFIICDELVVKNSKAYHKTSLKETEKDGISYVTRTNLNNGVESIVRRNDYKINQANTIVFGAENATFFYQPNEYITGNKMYFIQHDKLNKYSGLFLQLILNSSIKHCGFGYGKGLIGTRVQRRYITLPINEKGNPDFEFMEQYMRHKELDKLKEYQKFIQSRLNQLKNTAKTVDLSIKKWGEFGIETIFNVKSGVRLTKADMKKGNIPFIGATDSNNGITEFVLNTNNSKDKNVLGVNYNGSVVENFYHPYTAIFSDDVKRLSLKNIEGNEFLYLFLKTIILKQKVKYQYGYKFNGTRMKRQKIMLPINENNEPDYVFMENYIKNLEYKKLNEYIEFKEN